jgi:hypothetical protein
MMMFTKTLTTTKMMTTVDLTNMFPELEAITSAITLRS